MSAIAGIFNIHGKPADPCLIESMIDAVPHRGQDWRGYWSSNNIAMASRVMRTTPESLFEDQPISNADATLWIVYDGRVDNREDLISQLNLKSKPDCKMTDADILLHAYESWGIACVNKIIGVFAFAIWDARKRQFYCATDPLGVRRMTYTYDGKRFLFASECRQLLLAPTVSEDLSEDFLAEYLLSGYITGELTAYKNIKNLPRGHCLTVSAAGIKIWRHWTPEELPEVRYRNQDEYGEHFLDLFQKAVAARMRTAGKLGANLSGGLDSSSVVCILHSLYRRNGLSADDLPTFSLIFDEYTESDERKYINAVIDSYDLKHAHFVLSDKNWAFKSYRNESWPHYDEYPIGPLTMMDRALYKCAQEAGIQVLLTGLGGDQVTAGNPLSILRLFNRFRWNRLVQWARVRGHQEGQDPFKFLRRYVYGYALPRAIVPGFLHEPVRRLVFKWRDIELPPSLSVPRVPPWLHPRFAAKSNVDDRVREEISTPFTNQSKGDEYRMFIQEPACSVIDRYEATHYGIDLRHPFYDRRLVEYMLSVPPEEKIGIRCFKVILRSAMREYLPDLIRKREDKANFLSLFKVGISKEQGKISQTLKNLAQIKDRRVPECVDWLKLNRVVEEIANGTQDINSVHGLQFAHAVFLARWFEARYL